MLVAYAFFLLVSHTLWQPEKSGGWFVPYFYLFLGGALTSWRTRGLISDRALLSCVALMGIGFVFDPGIGRLYGALTMLFLYVAARGSGLNEWLAGSFFQRLGRMSYSIYLVHPPVAVVILGVRTRVAPNSNAFSLVAFFSVYLLSLGLAYFFHSAVEAPCLRLSRRLKRSPALLSDAINVQIPRA